MKLKQYNINARMKQMGMYIANIIMEIKDERDNDFIYIIKEKFPNLTMKIFNDVFTGIIGQLDLMNWDKMNKETDMNNDGVYEVIENIEKSLIDFSRLFDDKIFGYILMECFGGVCEYAGFAIKKGDIIFRQEYADIGHINILNKINNKFNKLYFEPFTREYINKK